jgi:hypothetical protein
VRRSSLLSLLACPFVLALLAARAEACSCFDGQPPCAAFGAASAVFVGTALDSRTREPKAKTLAEVDWTPVVVRFAVLQPFLGVEGAEVEVETGRGGGDCGYQFRKGESYLVYASRGPDGKRLLTSICSRTRPVSDASEDLEFLRGLGARGPGVSIDVKVERSRQSVREGSSTPAGGLAGARLAFEGAGESREVRTDSEGRARLSGLKPGTYKVRLALPEGLTTYKEEQEVTVADRGCAAVFYTVSDDGRVGGRVADVEGHAVKGVLVTLVEADDPEPERHYALYATTGADGRYDFKGLPPGRYLLAVNLNRYPQPNDPTNAYPRTYYPGVAERSQAEAVTVGAGEVVKDRDITLPARRAESILNGVVVWQDGSPVAGASISLRDLTYHDPGIDNGLSPADAQGRFTFKGYEGQVLLIHASSSRQFVGDFRRDGPMERSEPVRVTLAGPTERVRIVITKLR